MITNSTSTYKAFYSCLVLRVEEVRLILTDFNQSYQDICFVDLSLLTLIYVNVIDVYKKSNGAFKIISK